MGENSEKKVLCSPNNVRPVTSQLRETAVDRSPICESGLMTAGDTRFFRSQRKGEIAEWRDELRRTDLSVQKQAVKKVIAAMTVGKDVSSLFPDMVQCMQTPSLELKKLVYLYLINYAKSKPELTILAVNTFIKDAQDASPLVRALAVRTMGCIRVHRITEYLCDPLQLALTDADPYVRKTAVICVAKLFDIDAELVESRGFVDTLKELLYSETNPTVLSNAVAAMSEISSSERPFHIDAKLADRLSNLLTECTEWGQVSILDALAAFSTFNSQEASVIVKRVSAHLQHSNGSVVLASIKVLTNQLQVRDKEIRAFLLLTKYQKLIPETSQRAIKMQIASSLVTLLGSETEVQYVTLQCVQALLGPYKDELQMHLQTFFCRYNDPSCIKHAKLNILLQLVSKNTVSQVLSELKEYSSEVDLDFVRQAIRAVGVCANKFESAKEEAVALLLDLIDSKINYIVQEAIIVMKDIIKAYPNQFEHTIPILCSALSSLDQPEAKAALIWIVGEYAARIENTTKLLEIFCDTYTDEPDLVQLQLLTSAVKTFLQHKDATTQAVVQQVLQKASASENPDVRDRAFIYWRLLSSNAAYVSDVVF